jgi:hypothetical protein
MSFKKVQDFSFLLITKTFTSNPIYFCHFGFSQNTTCHTGLWFEAKSFKMTPNGKALAMAGHLKIVSPN